MYIETDCFKSILPTTRSFYLGVSNSKRAFITSLVLGAIILAAALLIKFGVMQSAINAICHHLPHHMEPVLRQTLLNGATYALFALATVCSFLAVSIWIKERIAGLTPQKVVDLKAIDPTVVADCQAP